MNVYLFKRLLTLTLPPLPATSILSRLLLITGVITLGLAITWLPPAMTALLLTGTLGLFFLLRRPILMLYGLIALIPFSTLLAIPLGGFKAGLMEMVLATGLAIWLLQLLIKQPNGAAMQLQLGPPAYLSLPLLLFLGSVLLSWLTTFSIGASLVETVKWVEVLLLYLFIANLLPLRDMKWVVITILLTGMAQAALGVYQFIFRAGPEGFLLFGGRFLRAFGTFAQPNPYAGYLGLVLPLALSLTIWVLFEAKIPKTEDFKLKILVLAGLSLSLGLLLAALFASQSRGSWLAFAIAAIATVIVRNQRPGMVLAVLVAVVAGVGLVGAFDWRSNQLDAGANTALNVVTQRFVDAAEIITLTDIAALEVTDANFATIERLAHWQAAREMWRDQPWLGVGFGNYAAIYPAYAVGRWLDPLGHAHNYLLNIGAEAGLIGISGYLIFWILAFGVSWLAIRRSHGFDRAVAAGNFGILVHLHIHNLFDNLYVQGMYLHIATILALSSVICYAHRRRKSTS